MTHCRLFLSLLILHLGYSMPRKSIQDDAEYVAEYDHRTPEEIKAINAVIFPSAKPEPLTEEHLKWMTARHKFLVKKAVDQGANSWEEMQKVADIYYEQHHARRAQSQKSLEDYCMVNLRRLLGDEEVEKLIALYKESATTEHIESAYETAIGKLKEDEEMNQAEQYGQFCKKIFRIVSIEPNQLMAWLNEEQRSQLQLLIIDGSVTDDDIYETVYQFYSNTTEDAEEAQESIDGACRRFISDIFGDDIVDELEDMRDQGINSQLMASRLAMHARELDNDKDRKQADKSLWLCERIYVGFDGHCQCGERADHCDETHTCQGCRDYTEGVMCEKCVEGFTWEEENCVVSCECNGHAESCDANGVCMNCTGGTEGKMCEKCMDGYIGVVKGSDGDCMQCECDEDEVCLLSETGEPTCVEDANKPSVVTTTETARKEDGNQSTVQSISPADSENNQEVVETVTVSTEEMEETITPPPVVPPILPLFRVNKTALF